MKNTGRDNRHTGKPENYCGSYPFKKESTTVYRKKGKMGIKTIHLIDAEIFYLGGKTTYYMYTFLFHTYYIVVYNK